MEPLLIREALKSPHNFKHGAILKSQCGTMVKGYNKGFTHAELSACRKGNKRCIL
jgi:hypothetical protein